MNQPKLLIADDEKHVAEGLQMILAEEGYDAEMATDGDEAWEKLRSDDEYGLVLADLKMPGLDGLQLFAKMREEGIQSEFIIITGKASVTSAVEAMRRGAYDYLTKPVDLERLKALIPNAIDKYQVRTANRRLQLELERLTRFGEMIGQSEQMREIYTIIEAVAPSNATVLVAGESGTGKELVARAMHEKSDRKRKAFIALNCGAFPREILENELFGHEKGAFTGATNEKPGAFEIADGGTLFLDEVAEMEPDIQVKFLRAVEQQSFRRLGGKKEISVDVRIIAATNKKLEDALEEGWLREDLYHRLAVIPITLPALREREGDILLLAEEFLRRFAEQHGKELDGFSEDALEYLQTYRWPGNVRQLKNAVERAIILSKDDRITARDLQSRPLALDDKEVHIPLGASLAEAERSVTLKTYAFTGGDHAKTARLLGISDGDLRDRLLSYMEGAPDADSNGEDGGTKNAASAGAEEVAARS